MMSTKNKSSTQKTSGAGAASVASHAAAASAASAPRPSRRPGSPVMFAGLWPPLTIR